MPNVAVTDFRHAIRLESATLGWNVVGVAVLVLAAAEASSVALIGFALDSALEIGASTVVLWELQDRDAGRRARALRWIGLAFAGLGVYLIVHATIALATGHHADQSTLGLAWTTATAIVMFTLAGAKHRVGHRLRNPVVVAEARVTLVDGILATAVVFGLALNAAAGWWWADSVAGLVVAGYALREARELLSDPELNHADAL